MCTNLTESNNNSEITERTNGNIISSSSDTVCVKRYKVDSITIYEISESDLELIERGEPTSVYLNISISLLSIFFSMLVTLLTCKLNDIKFVVFVCIAIISAIIGIVLLIIWFRVNKSANSVIKKIKSRVS